MAKSYTRKFFLIAQIIFLSISIFSCSSTKKIKYFQDIPDSGQAKVIAKAEYKALVIQPGDVLNINIQTLDPSSTSMVNSGNMSTTGGAPLASGGTLSQLSGSQQQQSVSGFLVDKEGYIEMPIIGKIKAAGSTAFQLKDTIYNFAVKYFKEPTVTVRVANFKVSILGEVSKPGQYVMADEKESVMDALALAGDLTIFGKRENVLLIRNNPDGTKITYRINLKNSNILASSDYYLRQNDVIYVEPRKAKSDATDAAQAKYVGIASAILSLLIIIATRAK